jgi:hypothetical protein
MRTTALVVLALGLTLTAGHAQEKLNSPWYPLAVDTTWTYKSGEGRFEMRVTKHEMVGAATTARVEMFKDGKPAGAEHIGLTEQGVCRFDITLIKGDESQTETMTPPVLMLKVPPKKGESFSVDSRAGNKPYKGTFKITEEDVTVPAGAFKAAVRVTGKGLEADGLSPDVSCWYAQGVGMVKQTITEGGKTITIELEKYSIGK